MKLLSHSGILMLEIALYHSGRTRCLEWVLSSGRRTFRDACDLCGLDERLEAWNSRRRIGGRACRISRLADATALHQYVILASQGHWTEGNHQKQVRYVGLRALTMNHVAFLRSETTDRWERFCWVRSPGERLFTGCVCSDSVALEYVSWHNLECNIRASPRDRMRVHEAVHVPCDIRIYLYEMVLSEHRLNEKGKFLYSLAWLYLFLHREFLKYISMHIR